MKKASWLAEIGLYLALALYAVWPALRAPDTAPGAGTDLHGTLWFFWWIEDSVRSMHSPSFTDLFYYPDGKDILAHTGDHFLDAVVALPLHALLGPVDFLAWWVVLLMVGNALALRPLVRSLVDERWAVVLACAVWEINPYFSLEVSQGRPTQAFAWTLPLAFLGLLRVERSWGWVVATGVLVALTGYGYWYYAYFFALAAVWLVGVEAWRRRADRPRLRRTLSRVGAAAGISILLVLPTVLLLAGDPASPSLLPETAGESYVRLFDAEMGLGDFVEPLLLRAPLLLILGGWLLWGRDRLRWAGVLVFAVVAAVGPAAHLGTRTVILPTYELLLEWLPWWHRLGFPYRTMILVWLVASLGLGTLAQRAIRLHRAHWQGRAAWLPPVSAAFVLGWVLLDEESYLPLPTTSFTELEVYAWLEAQGGAIIDLPLDQDPLRFTQQIWHPIPVFGGMGTDATALWPEAHARRFHTPCLQLLYAATHPDEPLEGTAQDCLSLRELGFSWVLLHRDLIKAGQGPRPDSPQVETYARLRSLLGDPVAVQGPMLVWSLDPSLRPEAPPALAPTREHLEAKWSED